MVKLSSQVIVVGAGPAGCLVSRRLCDAGHEVTLIEAGPGLPIPAGVQSLDWFDALNEPGWTHENVSVSRVAGQSSEQYLRGRGLGGCSAVNAMIALPGPEQDWPLFADEESGRRVLADIPLQRASLGPIASSLNKDGDVSPTDLLISQGRRASAYDIYLGDGGAGNSGAGNSGERDNRDRLEVLADTEVLRLIANSGRRVVGVELDTGENLRADHVVLCAGAIHSPVVLLRSGVTNHGVGVGLKDHPAIPFTLKLKQPGPVGTPAATGLLAWSSKIMGGELDLQVLILEHLGGSTELDGESSGWEPANHGQVMVALMDVESSGSIKIDSSGDPVVDFNMLSARLDRLRLRHGVRRLVELLEGGVLDGVVDEIYVDEAGPSLSHVPLGDLMFGDREAAEAKLDDWMGRHLGAYVHAGCSCRLNDAVGTGGVLRGWQGVSVIDASALPIMPRANTQVPTLILAEFLSGQLVELLAN